MHGQSLYTYWTLICFRSLAIFSYDLPCPNNGTPHALHVFKYWFAHHPPQSHKGSLRNDMKKKEKKTQTGTLSRKHPHRQKSDSYLILIRNQMALRRGESTRWLHETSVCCQESGNNQQSEDKTFFSPWLHHRGIILLFRRVLLHSPTGEKAKSDFGRPWKGDDYWIIHNVFFSVTTKLFFYFSWTKDVTACANKFAGFVPPSRYECKQKNEKKKKKEHFMFNSDMMCCRLAC